MASIKIRAGYQTRYRHDHELFRQWL